MKQLNNWQNAIFLIGATLMVVGAGASLLNWAAAPYIFALGALGFASMQMLQRYEGSNFVIRRLRRIMLLSDILFMVSAVLMFANQANVFPIDHITYLQFIYNKWVVTLLIAAILQLYTTHRIGQELDREAKKL
jgi:hypothetical protein